MNTALRPVAVASLCVAMALGALPLTVRAAAQQSDVMPPGGFVASCGAEGANSNYLPNGDSLQRLFDLSPGAGKYSCHSQMFSGADGSAQTAAAHAAPDIANAAGGTAAMGLLRLHASNASPAETYFAQGAANGGWSDTSTVTVDGLSGSAVWLINVAVSGSASVLGGSATFGATAYKDEVELRRSVAGFDRGGSDSFTTDRQRVRWRVSDELNNGMASRVVDDVVTFAVPVTLGTSFVWGVYGSANAGQNAATTGDDRITTADLGPYTMRFLGTQGVLVDGALYANAQVVSGSGIDWTQAAPVPEPGTWALMLGGLVWLARRRFT
jgi:hypothetical protein